jgi:undecaprenyl-diphosphatase
VSLDERWYRDVNEFARDTTWLHGFASAYALWAGLVILAAMLVAAYLFARRRPDAIDAVTVTVCAGIGVIVALLVNQHAISPEVGRTRPCHALSHVEVLLSCANDYSFPSDHCVLAGAFVAGLAFVGLRWALVGGVLALLLAFTRVYTGVHYPSDAGFGLLIGATIATIVVLLLRRPLRRLLGGLQNTRLRPVISSRPTTPALADSGGSPPR